MCRSGDVKMFHNGAMSESREILQVIEDTICKVAKENGLITF